ncbi:MAG: hypothetical protein JWO53_408, partial [Chlamydiia bacterium]|nr:hypothetical protein [Chlamydiia bacterium]
TTIPERLNGLSKIEEIPNDISRKESKNVLFLNCTMGGSHVSAADALIKYSKKDGPENPYRYHIRSLNVPLDVLLPCDIVHNTLGKVFSYMNTDWLFNKCMTLDHCEIIAFLRKLAGQGKASAESKNAQKALLREAILKENPDLLVMTYTWHAEPICELAQELGIPIMRLGLDFDVSGFKDFVVPRHFKLVTFTDHPKTKATIDGNPEFLTKHVEVAGPPLRPEFMETYTPERIQQIRQERGIADDEKVIFFANGALGIWSKVPEMIAAWKNPGCKIRLIVVCGRNIEFEKDLKVRVVPNIVNKELIKVDIQGFTEAKGMAELMHIAHLFIGKTGGPISSEALHCKTRFLSDETGYRLEWEKFNTQMLIDLQSGDRMTKLNQLIDKIKEQLKLPKPDPKVFPTDEPYSVKYARIMSTLIKEAEQDEETHKKRAEWQKFTEQSKMIAV